MMTVVLFLNMVVFLKGIKITILISLIGVALGSILGAFVALMKLSKIKIISWIASIYIEILRGTPMLVQVFIVFFGITAALGTRYFSSCLWNNCISY